MRFFKVFKYALLALIAVMPIGTRAQDQTVWQFAVDPGLGIGSADVLTGGVAQMALRCRGTAAPVSPNSYVTSDRRQGVASLLMPPNLFPQAEAAAGYDVTLSLDSKFSMRFPAVIGRPEGAYAARLLLNGPLLARMQSARQMTLSVAGGQTVQMGMTGSAQALNQLKQYCIPSVAQQALIPAPGFDCAKASTGVEVTICSFPDLADADKRMSQAYFAAAQQGRADATQHRAWLATREECRADARCILNATSTRTAELGGSTGQTGVAALAQPAPVPQATVPGAAQPQPGQQASTLQLQTGAPAPAPNAPPIVGQQEIGSAMLVWLFGQRPTLLSNEQQLMQYRQVQFPPGAPALDNRAWSDRNSRILWGQQMLGFARSRPFPTNVIYDIDANIFRDRAEVPFRLTLPGSTDKRVIVRAQNLRLAGNRGGLQFIARNPVELVLPDPIAQGAGADVSNDVRLYSKQSRIKLRLHLTLETPDLSLPIDAAQLGYSQSGNVGQGRMLIRQVELLKIPQRTQQGVEPQPILLHRWTPPATPPETSTDPLDTVEKTAAFYGGAVQGGRLIKFSQRAAQELGLQLPEGSFAQGESYNSQQPVADFALRLATVIKSTPGRPLSRDMTQTAAFTLLDQLERDQVLPLGFSDKSRGGSLNELERAQALRAAEPKMREFALARAPAMPMGVSAIVLATLGEYDLGFQGFPLTMNIGEAAWFPNMDLQSTLPSREVPGFVPVAEADALTLLQQLDVDSLNGRTLPVRIDYTVAGASTLTKRANPISAEELQRVSLGYAVERIVVFADVGFSKVLLDVPYPQAQERLAAFQRFANPDPNADPPKPGTAAAVALGLSKSSNESLLAPMIVRRYRDYARALVQQYPSIRNAPASTREQLIEEELKRIAGLEQDSYWIRFAGGPPSYESISGIMQLDVQRLVPFVVDPRYGGRSSPNVQVDASFQDFKLPISEEDYRAISGLLLNRGVLVAKMPLSGVSESGLTLSRPTMLAVLDQEPQAGQIPFPTLVVQVEAAKKLAPKIAGQIIPPNRLYLDHEGIDLLALAASPDLYDDAGFERMLIERAARERQAVKDGRTPLWGAFFGNPNLPLDKTTRADLLPKFKDWTMKRVAALPDQLILPTANSSGQHPVTGCNETFELQAGAQAGRSVSAKYDDILGAEAPALKSAFGERKTMGRSLPGSDRVFALSARPVLTANSRRPSCPYLSERELRIASTLLDNFAANAAPYVDAVIVTRAMPHPIGPREQIRAIDYVLSRNAVEFQPVARGTEDTEGFKGVLKIDGTVEAVDFWTLQPDRSVAVSATLTEEDWNAALGQKLKAGALDIVGLTLGMTEADLIEKLTARMPDGVAFTSAATARPNIFSHAVGKVDPAKSELIAAITAEASEGKPVVGILRVRDFAAGQATIPALVSLLNEKYGQPSLNQNNSQLLAWGVPAQELDRYGVCGGQGLFGGGRAPQIEFGPNFDQSRMRTLNRGTLQSYGWPQAELQPQANEALQYCGPSVSVQIQDIGQGALRLITWLFDRSATLGLAQDAERAAREAKPDLDL